MIISEIKISKYTKKEISVQYVTLKCDFCEKEFERTLRNQKKICEKYKHDLCRGCIQREQIRLGIRGKQYINAGISSIKNMKGKTHIEFYGAEKAEEMRKINSEKNSSINNKNYGGIWHGRKSGTDNKGKTYEEIHGVEFANKIKKKISEKISGEKNGMYGKPSPNGSGNGWSGWYNGFFFKSLLELSFLIKYVDRFNMECKSAENKKYRIKYKNYEELERNYFPDYVINDKYLIEIKPKHLINSFINKRKKESAIIFCKENNLIYKMITPNRLEFDDIKSLVENNKIKLLDRYKLKYEKYLEINSLY